MPSETTPSTPTCGTSPAGDSPQQEADAIAREDKPDWRKRCVVTECRIGGWVVYSPDLRWWLGGGSTGWQRYIGGDGREFVCGVFARGKVEAETALAAASEPPPSESTPLLDDLAQIRRHMEAINVLVTRMETAHAAH